MFWDLKLLFSCLENYANFRIELVPHLLETGFSEDIERKMTKFVEKCHLCGDFSLHPLLGYRCSKSSCSLLVFGIEGPNLKRRWVGRIAMEYFSDVNINVK
jgi:hypothetical protein